MDVCLRVLKESIKSRIDTFGIRNSVLIISHITFRDCRWHFFDKFSRNSCCVKAALASPKSGLLAAFDCVHKWIQNNANTEISIGPESVTFITSSFVIYFKKYGSIFLFQQSNQIESNARGF